MATDQRGRAAARHLSTGLERETAAKLGGRWAEEAHAAGHPAHQWLPDVVGRGVAPLVAPAVDPVVVDRVVAELIEGHATFGRADLLVDLDLSVQHEVLSL